MRFRLLCHNEAHTLLCRLCGTGVDTVAPADQGNGDGEHTRYATMEGDDAGVFFVMMSHTWPYRTQPVQIRYSRLFF